MGVDLQIGENATLFRSEIVYECFSNAGLLSRFAAGSESVAPLTNKKLKMPHFYFDIHNGDGCHRDEVGDHFDDLAQAQAQARALLPDIARGRSFDRAHETVACCVRDGGGEIVYRGELIFRATAPDIGLSRPRSGGTRPR